MLSVWAAKRRTADERRVIAAIGMLRPSRVSVWAISRLARISHARAFAALARLEAAGTVTAEWLPGTRPRQYVYRIVRKVADG